MVLQETLHKKQEQMIAIEQKVIDMGKSISEIKGKVEAPVRIKKRVCRRIEKRACRGNQ